MVNDAPKTQPLDSYAKYDEKMGVWRAGSELSSYSENEVLPSDDNMTNEGRAKMLRKGQRYRNRVTSWHGRLQGQSVEIDGEEIEIDTWNDARSAFSKIKEVRKKKDELERKQEEQEEGLTESQRDELEKAIDELQGFWYPNK